MPPNIPRFSHMSNERLLEEWISLETAILTFPTPRFLTDKDEENASAMRQEVLRRMNG